MSRALWEAGAYCDVIIIIRLFVSSAVMINEDGYEAKWTIAHNMIATYIACYTNDEIFLH